MEIVSFEVAMAIRKAGYPPLKADWSYGATTKELVHFVDDDDYVISAPTYLDVWLWLWREKNIKIDIDYIVGQCSIYDIAYNLIYTQTFQTFADPEEAIIAAIESLVENDLIK